MSTVPCPACSRPNAPHRGACLYCGHAMPNPQPRAAATRKQAPKNLDALIRRAMSRGNTAELTKALAEADVAEDAPPVHEVVEVAPLADVVDALVQKPPQPAAPDPDALYQTLRAHIEAASGWEDDPRAAEAELEQAARALSRLRLLLAEAPDAPELILPPFRQPFALFVDAPGSEDEAPTVARALETDHATARMIALARHPRVARRDGDRVELERLAAAYEREMARPATVLDEARLRALPVPRTALSLPRDGEAELVGGAAWRWTERLGAGPVQQLPPVRLAVSGEIVVKRFRIRRDKRGDRELEPNHERRFGVLDLHHDDAVTRVVEGLTTLDGWDLDGLSLRMAFRRFLESDHAEIQLGRRLCQPTRRPQDVDEQYAEADGWDAWEEHTRACRLLHLR